MYRIITDGSADLSLEMAKSFDVDVVPFYVSQLGDQTYKKELVELPIRDFYQFMVDHKDTYPKTSMPSIQDYVDVFEPLAKKGIDIICICITTKFSGSFNSANNAKEMVLEDYPDVKITVIDSTINTVLQGLLVEEVSRMQADKWEYDQIVNRIEEIKSTGRIFFTVGNMNYLVHGGRVGKLSGIAAGALGIKPIIVLKEGEIFSEGLARGRKKSINKVLDLISKHFVDNNIDPNTYNICVGYGYDKEEGELFRQQVIDCLKENYPDYNQEVDVRQIGATIGVHTGPYPLGIGCIKRYK